MKKHLKALVVAFILGFIFGPSIAKWIEHSLNQNEEESLVETKPDWSCLLGFKCYNE